MKYVLEIATSDLETTRSAVAGGADRIELCANLVEGGTTPSYGTIKFCRESFPVKLYPIIRPRGGDFLYTEEEFSLMLEDVALCRDIGCDGIVAGMLLRDGSVDTVRFARLAATAYPLGVTFHRAFDRCYDPFLAAKELIGLGCERILTSGQRPAAPEGAALIAELQKEFGAEITIMPGSGVRRENLLELVARTGCCEFHSSLRGKASSNMDFRHPAFTEEESYRNNAIDPDEVMELRKMLDELSDRSDL